MATYESRLTQREEVAHGTMAFHFAHPAGFQFKAGQSIDLTLLDPAESDAEGNTRAFSIASAPAEDKLTVATRMRDTAFKRVLRSAPLGLRVKLDGPMGSFTLHHNAAKPAVFLAGGIGITPFLSMARQAANEQLPHQIYLFYSNRRPEDAAFLKELCELEQRNPGFKLIATMTGMPHTQQSWTGETGFINEEMLRRYLPDLSKPVYYLAGPPGMVTAMRQMLAGAGADEDNIRTEEFAGY